MFAASSARKIATIVEITIAVNEPAAKIAVVEIAIPITSHDVVDPISTSSAPIQPTVSGIMAIYKLAAFLVVVSCPVAI
jgi:hypothetical protein